MTSTSARLGSAVAFPGHLGTLLATPQNSWHPGQAPRPLPGPWDLPQMDLGPPWCRPWDLFGAEPLRNPCGCVTAGDRLFPAPARRGITSKKSRISPFTPSPTPGTAPGEQLGRSGRGQSAHGDNSVVSPQHRPSIPGATEASGPCLGSRNPLSEPAWCRWHLPSSRSGRCGAARGRLCQECAECVGA